MRRREEPLYISVFLPMLWASLGLHKLFQWVRDKAKVLQIGLYICTGECFGNFALKSNSCALFSINTHSDQKYSMTSVATFLLWGQMEEWRTCIGCGSQHQKLVCITVTNFLAVFSWLEKNYDIWLRYWYPNKPKSCTGHIRLLARCEKV